MENDNIYDGPDGQEIEECESEDELYQPQPNNNMEGQGRRLEEKRAVYFTNVLQMWHQPNFDRYCDKELFARNVIVEMNEEYLSVSYGRLGSQIMELVLPYARSEALRKMMRQFEENLDTACFNQFSSYVLEKLFVVCTRKIRESHGDMTSYVRWAKNVGKHILKSLKVCIWDTYANRVLRTVLECYASLPHGVTCTSEGEWYAENCASLAEIPAHKDHNFYGMLINFCKSILQLDCFEELPYCSLGSGLLQTLLLVMNQVDKEVNKKIIKKLLTDCFMYTKTYYARVDGDEADMDDDEDETVPPPIRAALEDSSAARVVEAALTVAHNRLLGKIYEKCFKHNLVKLSEMQIANFCVQKLIAVCVEKDVFEDIFDELIPKVEGILKINPRVIVCLGFGCLRLGTKLAEFQTALMATFHCLSSGDRQKRLVPVLAKLGKHSGYNMYGSLLVQILLKYHKPQNAVRSLLGQTPHDLLSLFTSGPGCHIADAYLENPYIGQKNHQKLILKLKGHYVELACSRFGSRVLDAMWKASDFKYKVAIAEELLPHKRRLNGNEYGVYFIRSCALSLFRHRKHEWGVVMHRQQCNRKYLFQDVIVL